MKKWKDAFARLGYKTEAHFDRLKADWENRMGKSRPIQIITYYTYGTPDNLEIAGRILRDKGINAATDNDTVWDNLLISYRRFESDEVPNVLLVASFQGMEEKTVSDEEGYFKLTLCPQSPISKDMWQKVNLKIADPAYGTDQAEAQVLIPPAHAALGLISDIDDTIIETGVTNLLEMARNTFLKNARTRLPFPGAAEFYTALQYGGASVPVNPIFYVSNGPWNLFDFLADFIKLNGLPQGPILLRDLGLDADKFIKDDGHKIAQITHILNTYPSLPFVLIGDSGEKDPEIYQQIVNEFPGRIRAIYIRDVSPDERDNEVRNIAADISAKGLEMVLAADTAAAAEHAGRLGLIDAGTAEKIRENVSGL